MTEYIATETAVADLNVGDFVYGDGSDFLGGTLVGKEPHPDFPGALRLRFERQAPSATQGVLTVPDSRVAEPDCVVTIARPI